MTNHVAYFDESAAAGWERTLYAFLAEKQRRSGSLRTVQSYSRMLQHFFGSVGKTPEQVTSQQVFAWAYGAGLSGKQPGSITIGARLACLSSFYRFLIRMKIVTSNPCDAIERLRTEPGVPRGLSADGVQRLLAVVDAGGLKRTWKRIVRDGAVGHVRFHDLRHCAATYMIQAGVPIPLVSQRLGHTRVSTTTDVYAHVLPGMGREAAQVLENVMVNGWSRSPKEPK